MLRLVAIVALIGASTPAAAADTRECMVQVLRPITDDLGNRWAAGKVLPVTILRQGKDGGVYCAHGGSCVPRTVNGSAAVRLTNCRVGTAISENDYRLDLVPTTRNSAAFSIGIKKPVEDRLAELGFSNAAIGTWSNAYHARPQSADGRLVAQALAGTADAVTTMKARLP